MVGILKKNNKNFSHMLSVTSAYIIILSVLIICRDIINISVNKYILVLVCGVFYFFSLKTELIYMLIFTMPLLCGLPGNYIMPIACVFYLIKSRRINIKQLFFCCFIILMELIASLFYKKINIPNIVGYITNLMMFFCLIYDETKIDLKKCLYYYALGIFITSVVIVIATVLSTPTWMHDIATGYFRFGEVQHDSADNLNVTLNANALAFYSITGISCIVVLLKIKAYNRWFLLTELFFLVLTGLMTLSRTWLLVAFILLIIFVFSSNTSLKGIIKKIVGLVVLSIFIFLIMNNIPEVLEGMLNRFNRSDFLSGNGRFNITAEYMQAFFENLRIMLLGSGVTQYQSVMKMSESLHNSFIQILVCYGFIGATVFMLGWLGEVFRIIRKVKILYCIPFICIFIYSLSGQIINPYRLVYPHLIAIYAIRLGYLSKTQEELL